MSASDEKKALVMVVGEDAAKAFLLEHLGSHRTPAKPAPTPARRADRTEDRRRERDPVRRVQRGRVNSRGQRGRPHPASTSTGRNPVPLWEGYQLAGDSIMFRFAVYRLRGKTAYNPTFKASQIGLVVHGQTISQLTRLVKSPHAPPLHDKIIVMIGRNNILKGVPDDVTSDALKKCSDALATAFSGHGGKIKVVNLGDKFLNSDSSIKEACFEKFYQNSTRVDQIHLNRAGAKLFEDSLKEGISQLMT